MANNTTITTRTEKKLSTSERLGLVSYLQKYISQNKAKGVLTETEARSMDSSLVDGCWVLTPKGANKIPKRSAFFISNDLDLGFVLTEKQKTVFRFLFEKSVSVYFVTAKGDWKDPESIEFSYKLTNGILFKEATGDDIVSNWPSSNGRSSVGERWDRDIQHSYLSLDDADLKSLCLKQIFMYSYLKNTLRKSFEECTDIDAFSVVGGNVSLVEIKGKSRSRDGWFGIDIGRILMMCRFGFKGIYLVKELSYGGNRDFVCWHRTDFQRMITNCGWNTVVGGASMTSGFSTYTVPLPIEIFDRVKQMSSEYDLEKVTEVS